MDANYIIILADFEISSDHWQLRCRGVIEQARRTSGETGESTRQTLKQLALELLSKLVVNEEEVLQAGGITIYTKM